LWVKLLEYFYAIGFQTILNYSIIYINIRFNFIAIRDLIYVFAIHVNTNNNTNNDINNDNINYIIININVNIIVNTIININVNRENVNRISNRYKININIYYKQ